MEIGRSSKEIVDSVISSLKEYNIKYITPSDINNLGNLKIPEEISKIKRVLSLLVFMKVLKFNKEYVLWENMYYKTNTSLEEI